jgi:hypothetical protein
VTPLIIFSRKQKISSKKQQRNEMTLIEPTGVILSIIISVDAWTVPDGNRLILLAGYLLKKQK